MREGIAYLTGLLIVATLLYNVVVNSVYDNNMPAISFFLALLVSHFILEKNVWFVKHISEKWFQTNAEADEETQSKQG